MAINILCPLSLTKDPATKMLREEYCKRITQTVTFQELKVKTNIADTDTQIKKKQGEAIIAHLDKIPRSTAIVALDEKGKKFDSVEFSKSLEGYAMNGQSDYCFVIGGATGLDQSVLDRAHFLLSLGSMVWPHRLVSVMLLEQIYRAQQILAGHPYHKA